MPEARVDETMMLYRSNERPGIRKCLNCDQPFRSWHVIRNRVCPACKVLDNMDNQGWTENLYA